MKRLLEGRVAIVTGAGGGLGREHALFLARQGARVVVNDLAADAAQAVAAQIVTDGGAAVGHAASVTDERAIAALVERTLADFGRIDILVNNAGILRDKSFAKMSLDDFRLVLDVHLMGAVICTKAVWDRMREQKYGRIVMTTSSSGLFGNFGQSNYGAAKMALVGLMQTLGIEGEKYDIRVNCLAPSAATQMTEGVLSAVQPPCHESGAGQSRAVAAGGGRCADARHRLRRCRPLLTFIRHADAGTATLAVVMTRARA